MNESPPIFVHYCTDRFKRKVCQSVRNDRLTFKGTLHALAIVIEKEEKPTVVIEIYDNLKEVKTFLLKQKQNKKLPVIAVIHREVMDTARRCGKIGIDRVYMKVRHAVKQMQLSHVYTLGKISTLSGFGNYQQFSKTFKRIFDLCPSEAQKKVKTLGKTCFWQNHAPHLLKPRQN